MPLVEIPAGEHSELADDRLGEFSRKFHDTNVRKTESRTKPSPAQIMVAIG